MELVGSRRGELVQMANHHELARLEFSIPARGLIGLRSRMLTATSGEAIMYHRFESYRPMVGEIAGRANGVLVSMASGRAVAYALLGLQERSVLFIEPGAEVYEGMIVGENSRPNDLDVNITREKKQTNMRASTADEGIRLIPPRQLSLEQAIEFINDDELVEVTPAHLRLRKRVLAANQRPRKA